MIRFAAVLLFAATLAFSQGSTAPISGTVSDPSGAAVPAAEVTITNTATGIVVKTVTNEKGEFTAASLPAAIYRVSVNKAGFRAAALDKIELNSGVPANVNIKLEVGQANEVIEVAAGAEIVQTQSASVSSTIGGRQLFELPFATRNAVELLVTQPGVTTPGNPRSSSVDGLPRGALNVTIDGMNTQDNMLKSSDGFFSYIYPSVDSLDELTVTSSAASADASGQGAAQIKFTTKSGTNQWHGGGFYQRRQTGWDANYFFNNQQGLPRDVVKLTQRGFHVGGAPIKNKLFVFGNFEQYLLPGTKSYTDTIMTDQAAQGIFSYCPTGSTNAQCVANPSLLKTVNVYQLAQAGGFTSTPDPILLKTIQMENATAGGGTITPRGISNSDYNRANLNFQPNGNQTRYFLTSRIDYNITNNHHFSLVYNYDKYNSVPDFLNNVVDAFPNSGVVLGTKVETGQLSNRFAGTMSLRSQFGAHVTNEWRGGLNGGTVLFFPGISSGLYSMWNGWRPVLNYVSAVTTSTSTQRRNSPVKDVADNVFYVRGSHTFAFGGEFTQVNSWQLISSTDTMPSVSFAAATGDPILSQVFTAGNMPSSSATNQTDAAAMYSLLTGRVSSISKRLVLDEQSHKYGATPPIDRNRQREFGGYVQDTWRLARNLTVNLGLRFEKQGAYENINGLYSRVSYQALWGTSGVGNLFKPGATGGVVPSYIAAQGNPYTTPAAFAPSAGFAWQVPKTTGLLGKIFGEQEGSSVLRVGYNIATVREGQNLFISLWGANQGITQDASLSAANNPADFGAPGSVLFRNPLPTRSGLLSTPAYPIAASFSSSLNDFQPNMKLGYVQSWNIGWQRQLGKDAVVEFRYTGNHGVHLWRQYNLNEVNIFESGFLGDFVNAQNNLKIARGGNINNNTSVNNWGNQGLPGQVPVVMLQTAIGNTTDATIAQNLQLGQAGTAANSIATNVTRLNNLTGAASKACSGGPCPQNIFMVNPTVGSGGSFVETNDGTSYYDALQIEARRRMSHGFTAQFSYVWSKSLADGPVNSSSSVSQPTTLRNLGMDKVPSGFDMRHAFKANWVYELPFGPGRQFAGSTHGILGKALEGWEANGVVRVTSGLPFFLTSFGTVNNNGDGIVLHNMTAAQLQSMVNINKTTGTDGKGIVYFLPTSLIQNTQAAYNTGGFTPAQVDPNAPYIGPASAGQFGWRGYLYSNWSRFFDASIVKRTRIHESMNVEFRATAINVFNMTQFGNPGSGGVGAVQYGNIGSTFGQVTGAYRDISGTVEPGGRILEFMLRFNF
jgi:hypothetical protein